MGSSFLIHPHAVVSEWKQRLRSATSDNVWIARDGAELVCLPSGAHKGRLVLYGGWQGAGQPEWDGNNTTNEINASDDRGKTWTQLAAHDTSPPTSGAGARPGRAHTMGLCLHTDVNGDDQVMWIGGDYVNPYADVWRFPVSEGGYEDAERLTEDGPTADGTILHRVVSYRGDLYCIGGQYDLADADTAHSHVWRSTNDGLAWTQLDDAPWAGRSSIGLTVHRDRIIVVGGAKYHTTDAGRTYYNDVWEFDGEDWTELLADGHAQFAHRHYHNLISTGGRLWIFNGYAHTAPTDEKGTYGTSNLRSVFFARNHLDDWTRFANAEWGGSHADGMCVGTDGRIYRAAGNRLDTATYEISR